SLTKLYWLGKEQSVHGIRQIASNSANPKSIGLAGDSIDPHSPESKRPWRRKPRIAFVRTVKEGCLDCMICLVSSHYEMQFNISIRITTLNGTIKGSQSDHHQTR